MSYNDHAPVPLGGKLVTPVTIFLGILSAIAVIILLVRFVYGLGAVTNISDGYPWGIWVVYDVMIGSAFACGGYAVALLVYILNKGEYHPLVRPALLGSLFGYTLAGASVIFDLGRWWNTWHIFWPGYAQVNSVMFEVAVCITIYIMVMWIEFSPAFLDKLGKHGLKKKVEKYMFVFIGLGVLLPSMHQSSLGSLVVVMGPQINPLWQTVMIPLIFLLTAITVGYAIVVFESCLSSSGFKRTFELSLISRLSKVMWIMVVAYLAVRFLDIIVRGAAGYMFHLNFETLMFWIEMACFIAPAVILAKPANRRHPGKLFATAALLMLGTFLLRINAFLVGYDTGDGWHYFPSLPEMMVTIGVIAMEILGYIVLVRYLPILPAENPAANK
ncbi:MAG: Ni/Fe-hydrogenase cytochrome b subunit [Sulfuricella sp.]|nr:Ni/Fe-hydrogenase cytochrome b subunit [Sulfuricella sp.]